MKTMTKAVVGALVLGAGGAGYHFATKPSAEQVKKMYQAVRNGDLGEVNALLAKNKRLARAREDGGHSVLVTATSTYPPIQNQSDISQALLAHGADPNDTYGSPLHGAIYCSNAELVRSLLMHGADPDLKPKGRQDVQSPYEEAKWRGASDIVRLFDEHLAKAK